MTLRSLAVALLVCTGFSQAVAQQPLSVGTATSLGDAAVTEARRTDALGWNPALLGLYDGPVSSYSFLAPDIAALPGRGWSGPARELGLGGTPSGLQWVPSLGGEGGALVAGRLQWLATQNRDFALSLASHHFAAGAIPDGIAVPLGGTEGNVAPAGVDSTVRVTSSVLSLGRALHVGRLPVLGGVWLGATAKGWLAHSYARGGFRGGDPAEEVYREVGVRNVPGYGLDFGVVAQPFARVRIGASVVNAVSGTFPRDGAARVRSVSVVPGEDGDVQVEETYGPPVEREDDGTDDGRLAAALWKSVGYPAVLRAGATIESDAGSFSGAVQSTLRAGGFDPEWEATPFTLAYAGPAALPFRASYGWGSDATALALGMDVGGCERRWNLGVVRRNGGWGTSYGLSASLTVGSRAGCDLFRS